MRRNRAAKRKVLPDPRYKSELVSKFINTIMEDGKKSVAEKIVYGALDIVVADQKGKGGESEGGEGTASGSAGGSAVTLLEKVIEAVGPKVEVKSRRVGGSTYQVPMEVRAERRVALAMRWLRDFARKRGEKTMRDRLAREIIDALAGRGGAVKKREETFRMAEANKAFAHYKW